MPLYEFKCHKCGNLGEFLLKFGEKPDSCPDCGGEWEKLYSANAPVMNSDVPACDPKGCPSAGPG